MKAKGLYTAAVSVCRILQPCTFCWNIDEVQEWKMCLWARLLASYRHCHNMRLRQDSKILALQGELKEKPTS